MSPTRRAGARTTACRFTCPATPATESGFSSPAAAQHYLSGLIPDAETGIAQGQRRPGRAPRALMPRRRHQRALSAGQLCPKRFHYPQLFTRDHCSIGSMHILQTRQQWRPGKSSHLGEGDQPSASRREFARCDPPLLRTQRRAPARRRPADPAAAAPHPRREQRPAGVPGERLDLHLALARQQRQRRPAVRGEEKVMERIGADLKLI